MKNKMPAKYWRDYRKKNYTRFRAREMARKAIKIGKLIRQKCEFCGESVTEAHHDDYQKPLAVRWLCRKHHRDLHKNAKTKRAQ